MKANPISAFTALTVLNGYEKVITEVLWSETFRKETLSCKIEKRFLFSIHLMHLLVVLWKSLLRVIWISIGKEPVCDQKASRVKSLPSSVDDPDRWQLSIPWRWKWDSRQNLRGMKFEEALEDWVSLREKGGDILLLCLSQWGDSDRLKTRIYVRVFVVLDVYFTAAVCAWWSRVRSS